MNQNTGKDKVFQAIRRVFCAHRKKKANLRHSINQNTEKSYLYTQRKEYFVPTARNM